MEYVPDSELAEIRSIIGEALIDFYTDLYAEVEMWGHIWRDSLSTQRGTGPKPALSPLADPPAIKALLKAEIQLLLKSVRDRAAMEGRDGDAALSRFSPNVVTYALGSPRSSVENRDTPSRSQSRQSQNGSRSSSCLSSISSLEDEIESMKTKLSISHVDEVVSHLRIPNSGSPEAFSPFHAGPFRSSVCLWISCSNLSLPELDMAQACACLKAEAQCRRDCNDCSNVLLSFLLLHSPPHPHPTTPHRPSHPHPTPCGAAAELREQRKVIQMDLQQQALMSGSASPDKAASLGPLARSRQKIEWRASDLGLCRTPTPPLSPAALPRPPYSRDQHRRKSAEQLSTPHLDRTAVPSPSPDLCTGLSSADQAPEWQREAGYSPDTTLPRPRWGGSRAGEQTLLPLAVSCPTSASELGLRPPVAAMQEDQPGRPVDALAARLNHLCPRSGKNMLSVDVGGAATLSLSLPRSSSAMEGNGTRRPPLDALVPCPPVSQKPANRGPSVARRLGIQQLDRLVSPS
ncbi:hypothetical protein ACEWY4_006437 [Coilia grayii]|uniref:Coiled-coil domain-containing protein 24 n=1 Tax=Coilia grayii TaxID=363190 RepID=A0ABD1KDK7_9TELE